MQRLAAARQRRVLEMKIVRRAISIVQITYIVEQPRMSKDRLDLGDLRARKVQAAKPLQRGDEAQIGHGRPGNVQALDSRSRKGGKIADFRILERKEQDRAIRVPAGDIRNRSLVRAEMLEFRQPGQPGNV